MKKHLNIRVEGLVQGVFFRKSTVARATSLGLHGFVMNVADGSVYIEAEGSSESLNALLEWCHNGPDGSKVDRVQHEEATLIGMNGFIIKG